MGNSPGPVFPLSVPCPGWNVSWEVSYLNGTQLCGWNGGEVEGRHLLSDRKLAMRFDGMTAVTGPFRLGPSFTGVNGGDAHPDVILTSSQDQDILPCLRSSAAG